MVTRRDFLKSTALFGAAIFIPNPSGGWFHFKSLTNPTLDPKTLTKYSSPLAIPLPMPGKTTISGMTGESIDYYEITLRQFQQQILPAGLPLTTVWSYGSASNPSSFFSPACTIEAQVDRPVRVKWINGLVNNSGQFLPHLFTVDPTLHWANPPGPRDEIPTFNSAPQAYRGPIPMVTHLHGAHSFEHSDGFPESWYLPEAADIPAGYFKTGSFYDEFSQQFADTYGVPWSPGSATFQYPNDQAASTLWYHDHAIGLTRLNVYSGAAGFYFLRGGSADLPSGTLPNGSYEIPLVIQDRSFNQDGSLFYPDSREFFDGFTGPFVPDSDMAPFWNPETFGNIILANGRAWPHVRVQTRRYRLRILNACNARTLILKIASDPRALRPAPAALPIWQVGADGGFLPKSVQLEQIILGPAERADIVLDFSQVAAGTKLYLINEGPDEPFGGGTPNTDFPAADPYTTGQVLKFDIGSAVGSDPSLLPDQLSLPKPDPLIPGAPVRKVSMNELDSNELAEVGPRIGQLGLVNPDGTGEPMRWMDDPSEVIPAGTVETWEIHNFTEDAHPLHIHLVQFQLVNRESMGTGQVRQPLPQEQGLKDTILVYPAEITRIQAKYDRAGRYVWHCHILEHEDNEMMRPMLVSTTTAPGAFKVFLPNIQGK